MFLLYGDETNVDPTKGDFFIYAAIVIRTEHAGAVRDAIQTVRTAFEVPSDFVLKFNPGPTNLDHAKFAQLKASLLALTHASGARLIAAAIHHPIIKDGDVHEARRYLINGLLARFDSVCRSRGEHGMAIFDRFDHDTRSREFLEEKMTKGVTFDKGANWQRLERLLGCHMSSVWQSPFCQLADVALGTLRCAVGIRLGSEKGKSESADAMFKLLGPMFPRRGDGKIIEEAFCFYPRIVKVLAYRERYVVLRDALTAAGMEPAQQI